MCPFCRPIYGLEEPATAGIRNLTGVLKAGRQAEPPHTSMSRSHFRFSITSSTPQPPTCAVCSVTPPVT
jgi:hypothetical protein